MLYALQVKYRISLFSSHKSFSVSVIIICYYSSTKKDDDYGQVLE